MSTSERFRRLEGFFVALLFFVGSLGLRAQVDNYALRFTSDEGVVNLGTVSQLSTLPDYTIQMWICPDAWRQGGALMRCGEFSIKLGREHSVVVNDGRDYFVATSSDLASNTWSHLTLRVHGDESKLYVNNNLVVTYPARMLFPRTEKSVWLGGKYRGRIDEVRIWANSLSENYESYWRTTLNEFNPSWNRLVGYWKMDQEKCAHLVDYRFKNHGTLSPSGVRKVKVTDNALFKYLISLAYGNIERFFDRTIDHQHYWLANRISIIGATVDTNNGHANLYTTYDEATPTGGAQILASHAGRSGVLSFPTPEACLNVPSTLLNGYENYTLEMWVCVDEWREGAFLFRKENGSGSQGISIRLGQQEDLSLTVRCNGQDYTVRNVGKVGSWFHIGLSPRAEVTGANKVFNIVVDGSLKTPAAADAPSAVQSVQMPSLSTPATVGEGLVGKVDEVMFWSTSREAGTIASDRRKYPMPGEDVQMAVENYYSMKALYCFDLPERPGFDSYSVQGFFEKMRSYVAGMRGCKFTLTVAANNFEACLANGTKRAQLAADIAAMGNDDAFDGIDLDFEWTYTSMGWNNIALLCQALRQQLKPGKILSVSPHKVAYGYPTDKMDCVDYFNFQCYGPGDQGLCTTDGFVNAAALFLNHGYPRDKIVMSYSTTTTSGYKNGSRDTNLQPQGYRYLYPGEDKYDPTLNYMHNSSNGADYWIAGFEQVVWRNKWVVDNDYAGMMYWDLGNDLPSTSKHSMARGSSYYLNSNVEKLVTEVTNPAVAPADDPLAPTDTPDPEDQGGELLESVVVKSLADIQPTMAYTLTNTNGLGTIYSKGDTEKLWLGASSNANFGQAVDLNSLSALWLLINYQDQYYLYNLGRGQFVEVAKFNVTSQPCTFTDEAVPLEVTERYGSFTFRTFTDEERGYMCASPQLVNQGNPVCQWTIDDAGAQWTLTTAPNVRTDAYYLKAMRVIDPTGLETPETTRRLGKTMSLLGKTIGDIGKTKGGLGKLPRGVYIRDGRKVVM